MRNPCPFSLKAASFLFLFLIFLPLLIPSAEGIDCDCDIFKKSLEEADKVFQELKESPQDAEILFLNCMNRIYPSGVLVDYCAHTFLEKGDSDRKAAHAEEKKRITRLHEACLDTRERCREWRKKEAEKCVGLEGKERAPCYSGKNLWEEFEGRFPEEAKEYKKSQEEERQHIKNFLYAKSEICDKKYKEDESRKERCVSNFRNKYNIQALFNSYSQEKKMGTSGKKSPHEEKKDHVTKPDAAASKDREAFMLGRWLCEESAFIFEIAKSSGSYKLECLAGCGSGEENAWIQDFNFTRKYSKYNKLGTGYFDETCVFDDAKREFTCDGMVKYVTKYGSEDQRRIETRHCSKIVGF